MAIDRTKDTLSTRFMKWFVRHFKRRPTIISLGEEAVPAAGSIIIANHSGASGPMNYRTFLSPPPMMIWAAHGMCSGYRERRRYLIDIFYGQKLGYGKVRAWVSGTLFAIFSRFIYDSAGVIPVYYDGRAKQTFTQSVEVLKEGISVLIFPENSSEGYKEEVEEFFGGYITLARAAARSLKKEPPVYCMSYSKKRNSIVIGAPMYVSELFKTMSKSEINEHFRTYLNSLKQYYPEKKRKT